MAAQMAAPDEAGVSLAFDGESLPRRLARASEEDLNKADFGIIQLDDDGIV
jgi:hypothetical protein